VCLVLFSLVAAAFLTNKDIYIYIYIFCICHALVNKVVCVSLRGMIWMRLANVTGKLSIGLVKFCNDGMVQAVIEVCE